MCCPGDEIEEENFGKIAFWWVWRENFWAPPAFAPPFFPNQIYKTIIFSLLFFHPP